MYKGPMCLHRKRLDHSCTIYVDDLLLLGKSDSIAKFKEELSNHMDVKDLGDVSNFLSMKINRPCKNQLIISPTSYINEVLQEFSMSTCRSFTAPLETGCLNIDRDESNKFCQHTFRKAVGNLLYLSGTTRADIAYATCLVSQFCEDPVETDWQNVKHIFQYLKGTMHYSLHYRKTGKTVKIFTDSDWANNKMDAKSITGYVFILAGAAICWRSRKQRCVAASSTHAEYIAMLECVTEFKWLRDLLRELGQNRFVPKPCNIFADNAGAMCIASSIGTSDRSKHINVKYHYNRQLVQKKEIVFQYVKSSENVADLFTKPLKGPRIKDLTFKLGIY